MTYEKCIELVVSVAEHEKKFPDCDTQAPAEKIAILARMSYLVGFGTALENYSSLIKEQCEKLQNKAVQVV